MTPPRMMVPMRGASRMPGTCNWSKDLSVDTIVRDENKTGLDVCVCVCVNE